MKVEEAIEILKRDYDENIHEEGYKEEFGDVLEAEKMAISALEKQVAKKPKTNADRIRAMPDEKLADFLDNVFNNIFDEYEFPCEFCTERINCDVCFVEWLKKEVEDGKNN